MKKFYICAMIVLISVLTCTSVCAQEDVHPIDEADMMFPPTSYDCDISLMSGEDETLEDVITAGWDALATDIDISKFNIEISEFETLYHNILYNNPVYQQVYTNGRCGISTNDKVHVSAVHPTYENDANTIAEYRKAIDNAAEEIMFHIDADMTDFEKIMTVHDYMALNYSYDLEIPNHTITVMTTKKGVCQAYAYAFKHMMNLLDIDCTYVTSDVLNHMWNLVMIDGKWYHIDVTWDDPTPNKFGQVSHRYALLSSSAIQSINRPHYGFNLGELKADSTKYDRDDWHDGVGSVVYCNGNTYWWDDDDLVRDDYKEIVDDIVRNKAWNIGTGTTTGIYAGLATHNGKLYYNSDKAIYSYDPETGETEKLLDKTGICGLYIDKNTLYYTTAYIYKIDDSDNAYIGFEKGGEISLGDTSVGNSYREGDTVVTRVCNTAETPVTVFVFNGTSAKSQVCENGVSKVEFETETPATIFVWDSNLRPLSPKQTIE